MKAEGVVVAPSIPSVVSVEQNGRRIRIGVRGNVIPLLRELDGLDMEDLVYEQALPEDISLDYYREVYASDTEEDSQGP